MADPIVVKINQFLTKDDFRRASEELKKENPNIIVLPAYCDLLYPALIKCRDCKYYLKSDEQCQLITTRLHFYETGKRWAEDSFCSWAERRNILSGQAHFVV